MHGHSADDREALYNIRKHAGATRVAVAIEKMGKVLEISIDDNGRGFHFSGTYSLEELELLRLGPVSLKQRARSLNADLMLSHRARQRRRIETEDLPFSA